MADVGDIVEGVNTDRIMVVIAHDKMGVIRAGKTTVPRSQNTPGYVAYVTGTLVRPYEGELTDEEQALAFRLLLIGE